MSSRIVLACLSVLYVALVSAGCNTVEGVGKDVKAAGQAIERAAKPK